MKISARGNFANDVAQLKNPDHQQMVVEFAVALTNTNSNTYTTYQEGKQTVIGYTHDKGMHGEDW